MMLQALKRADIMEAASHPNYGPAIVFAPPQTWIAAHLVIDGSAQMGGGGKRYVAGGSVKYWDGIEEEYAKTTTGS